MTPPTWPALLTRLLAREDLTAADTAWAMREVMTGEATPAQVAALAVALRAKGEAPAEVAGLAATMLEQATPVQLPLACVDIVGTGGDGSHTFNISTCSMFVAAAAGARVSKHGGRSVSSKSGSADVLEALGLNINLSPEAIAKSIEQTGIGKLRLHAERDVRPEAAAEVVAMHGRLKYVGVQEASLEAIYTHYFDTKPDESQKEGTRHAA